MVVRLLFLRSKGVGCLKYGSLSILQYSLNLHQNVFSRSDFFFGEMDFSIAKRIESEFKSWKTLQILHCKSHMSFLSKLGALSRFLEKNIPMKVLHWKINY